MTPKEIFAEFNSMLNDTAKWAWLMKNQDKNVIVKCDNDWTYIIIEGFDEDSEGWDDDCCGDFDEYTGWTDGVMCLLKSVGIRAEQE